MFAFFEKETAPCAECEWVMNFEAMMVNAHQTDEKTRLGEVSAGSEITKK